MSTPLNYSGRHRKIICNRELPDGRRCTLLAGHKPPCKP